MEQLFQRLPALLLPDPLGFLGFDKHLAQAQVDGHGAVVQQGKEPVTNGRHPLHQNRLHLLRTFWLRSVRSVQRQRLPVGEQQPCRLLTAQPQASLPTGAEGVGEQGMIPTDLTQALLAPTPIDLAQVFPVQHGAAFPDHLEAGRLP